MFNDLEYKTAMLMDRTKELMGESMKLCGMGNMDLIKDMDADSFSVMQKSIKLMDSACELAIAQAKMMDTLNAKLDEVLEHLEKMERN